MTLILTPLLIEFEGLLESLGPIRKEQRLKSMCVIHMQNGIALAVGGHGKVQFALSTQLLIQEFSPSLVICAGAAGSLSGSVQTLDVVVGTETVEHDYNLRFIKKPRPRFQGDSRALDHLRAWSNQPHVEPLPPLHFGAIASGDEDILEKTRAQQIFELTGALAVGWEGAGSARACQMHRTPHLEIRAVTDTADHLTPMDFARHVLTGMTSLAPMLVSLAPKV